MVATECYMSTLTPLSARITDTPICRGGTSDIYPIGGREILKLLYARYPRSKAEREFEVTREVSLAGLPVPAVREVAEIEGRWGIILERIDGPSLLQFVERRPWKLFFAAGLLAELHAKIHQITAPAALPSQRSQLESWLANAHDFSCEQRKAAEESLALVPSGSRICHGDFHPANILLSSEGPRIIDWSTATRGDPVVDVGRTCVLFESANLPPDSPGHTRFLLAVARRLLHRTYLKRYFQLCPGSLDQLRRYLPIQRAATSAWRCTLPD